MSAARSAVATRNPLQVGLLLFLGYAALAGVYLFPAPLQLGTHLLGGPFDGPMFLWNVWWAPHAVFELGQSPLATDHLYAPFGTSLAINTHAVFPALLSAPLQWAFGLVPAYNLSILVSYALSGLAMALLANELCDDWRAAAIAGSIFAFAPTRTSFVVFFNLIHCQWLVFFIWALVRAERRDSLGAAALAGIFTACVFYTSYNLFVLALAFGLGFAAYHLGARWRAAQPVGPLLRQWAALVGVATVLAAPGAVALLQAAAEDGDNVARPWSSVYKHTTPVAKLFLREPLAGSVDGTSYEIHRAAYLGVVALALAAWGVVRARPRRRWGFWLAITLLFLVVSLGTHLNWNDDSLAPALDPDAYLPLPFGLVKEIPLFNQVRAAHRWALLGIVGLSVLAAFGTRELLAALEARSSRPVVGGALLALGLLVFLDFAQLPFPKRYALPATPGVLAEIARDPRHVSVLQYPTGRQGYPLYSYFQTLHRKPVYRGGELARLPRSLKGLRVDSALFGAIREKLAEGPAAPRAERIAAMRAEAREFGVGWLLVAWADKTTLRAKRPTLPSAARFAELDALLREAFPTAERRFVASEAQMLHWAELPPEEAASLSALHAAYRIPLDD